MIDKGGHEDSLWRRRLLPHPHTRAQLYVDRTDRIAGIEDLGDSLLFLRPRRFGKSLWLSTLACYYDLRLADEHERLFGDLAVGKRPTPLAHRYFILAWDFSDIDPDPPPLDSDVSSLSHTQRLSREIHRYLNSRVKSLVSDLREHLPGPVAIEPDAFSTLENLLDVIRRTPYRLYLLIDEYDNFANEILTADRAAYEQLVHNDGPFKRLFKWVKAAMGRNGLERLFITGVSPLVMSDVTSGMNIAENVYLYPELNSLCGFTDKEVRGLLEDLHQEKTSTARPPWTVADARVMMRDWYNGYRFATGAEEAVYNPTLALYFLKYLQRTDTYPDQMLDSNLAADEGKLDYIAEVASGQDAVIDLIRQEEPLEIFQIRDRFTLKQLLEHSAQDTSFLGSYLFYFGMLTLRKKTGARTVELVVPNEVIRGLYIVHSEPELDHQYADLCLLRRPDARTSSLWDLLFEFKRPECVNNFETLSSGN